MRFGWLMLCALPLWSQAPVTPSIVGLVVKAAEGTWRPAAAQSDLRLREGDLLAVGDRLMAGPGTVVWFCPGRQEWRFTAAAEIELRVSGLALRGGTMPAPTPLAACQLPASIPAAATTGSRLTRPRAVSLPEAGAGEPAEHVVRGSLLAGQGRHAAAAAEFRQAATAFPGVDWPRALVHLEESRERELQPTVAPTTQLPGKTYALVVGISNYPQLSAAEQLHFADKDAEAFAAFLRSEKGGALPERQIRLLTNRAATKAAIETSIATFLSAQAGPQDTVILFFAAHGIVDQRGAFLIAHDSDPEDLATTAVPMLTVQRLLAANKSEIGRVAIYIDVCRAGKIGTIRDKSLNQVLSTFLQGAETYGLLATAPGENSIESERFGGGHGAFSYFLLRGLNGEADQNSSRSVQAEELYDYVRAKVREATTDKQHPRIVGTLGPEAVLVSDTQKPGIALADWTPADIFARRQAAAETTRAPVATPVPVALEDELEQQMEAALGAGRLLPTDADSAFFWLDRIRRQGQPANILYWENRLYVALLERGQQAILRYLRGDRVPQVREDFVQAADAYRAALQIDPEALAVEARALFCEGRALIFERRYPEAQERLERAVRLDPDGAYHWNALGIAALEQARYAQAAAAFRDATRLAVHWLYPRHNLALTLAQAGQRRAALEIYAQALNEAPGEAWLLYQRGLLQADLGRTREAERSFRAAAQAQPGWAAPLNALGYLQAEAGHSEAAERLYREALARQPGDLPTRHNLALLLAAGPRRDQAMAQFREILAADPGYLPSRLSLAEALLRNGQAAEAVAEWRTVLAQRPDYLTARIALARALGDPAEFERAVAQAPDDAGLLEEWGDALAAAGLGQPARDAYRRAQAAAGPAAAKRLARKLK